MSDRVICVVTLNRHVLRDPLVHRRTVIAVAGASEPYRLPVGEVKDGETVEIAALRVAAAELVGRSFRFVQRLGAREADGVTTHIVHLEAPRSHPEEWFVYPATGPIHWRFQPYADGLSVAPAFQDVIPLLPRVTATIMGKRPYTRL